MLQALALTLIGLALLPTVVLPFLPDRLHRWIADHAEP